MYHRIIERKRCDFPIEDGMYVEPKTFEMHLKFIRENFEPVDLKTYCANRNNTKDRLITLTFDDGWKDFKDYALEHLDRYKIPAHVFLPTKFIGSSNLFWTDKISYIFSKLTLGSASNRNSTLKFISLINEISQTQLSTNFSLYDQTLPILLAHLKEINFEKRKILVDKLHKLQQELIPDSINPIFMNWHDIQEISKNPLISFGQHSHSHNISTEISPENLKEDIARAKQCFIDNHIPCSEFFCYPNEMRNLSTDAVIKDLGYSTALGKKSSFDLGKKTILPIIDRIGIHQDISYSLNLFKLRLLGI